MFNLGKYFLPPAKSTFAHNIDGLFNFITNTGAILLLGIVIVMIYFVIKYRRRSEDDVTSLVDHNTPLEITWSIIPLILIMIIFSWGFRDYIKLFTPPQNSYEINVTAQQWLWKFTYPNGQTSVNKLYVPEGRPVKLVMKSNDVIHSFFIPDYRVKHDVLPSQYSDVWFQVDKPDTSDIFCTQYCGLGHSNMHGLVIVEPQDKFDAWLKQGSSKVPSGMTLAQYGKKLYQSNGCNSCHSINGKVIVGPSWKGIYGHKVQLSDGKSVTVNDNYIRESILNPGAKIVKGFNNVMPTFQGVLNNEQIDAIIAFIKEQK